MTKKDKMLNIIKRYINNGLMRNSYEFFSYDGLNSEDFSRAKSNFASGVDRTDVVCLISTSNFGAGKCGLLFTTDRVYIKPYMSFSRDNYYYSDYIDATFSGVPDFNESKMRSLMQELDGTSDDVAVTKKKSSKRKAAAVAVTGGIAFLSIASKIAADHTSNSTNENYNRTLNDTKKSFKR